MLFMLRLASRLLLFVFAISTAGLSHATSIQYEAIDLTDTTPGEDLWLYSYQVDDFLGAGFSVYFDYTLFTDLESPPPSVNADWDPITFQPDVLLPDDGIYDAYALSSSPSLADPFVVSFVWLGSGAPGAQPFEVYNSSFQPIELGQTIPVPEPTPLHLMLCGGLLSAVGLRRRRR